MPAFSKTFLEEIKEALMTAKARVLKQLAELTNKEETTGTGFPNYGDGEDESAGEVATYDTNLQVIDTLQSELRDIDEALKRVNNDTYGICKYCQQPIDEHRLQARPTSSSCITCKKTLTQEM